MRSMWKGNMGCGLVGVQIKLYATTEAEKYDLHQVHKADGGQIKFRRFCSTEGVEVPYEDVAKGYITASGKTIILTDEDIDNLPLATMRDIQIDTFVPASDIDPLYYAGKSYFIEPEAASKRAYKLIMDAMVAKKKVAVARVVLRNREHIGLIRPTAGAHGRYLALHMLEWPEMIRSTYELRGLVGLDKVKLPARDKELALQLVDVMSGEFDGAKYTDTYTAALTNWLENKIEITPAQGVPATSDADLQAALIASVTKEKSA